MFDGREIHGSEPAAILEAGIAHCPEGRRVFPYLTVEENLAMGAYVRRDRTAIAADLDEVGRHFPILAERRRQMAGTLSGGEQQMLAIARALMARPRLILFDEPSLGLAPTVVETTFGIIADIRRRGTTVLMVEQNAYAALRMADRAYVMETGRIVLEGARPRPARRRPRAPRVSGRLRRSLRPSSRSRHHPVPSPRDYSTESGPPCAPVTIAGRPRRPTSRGFAATSSSTASAIPRRWAPRSSPAT